MFTLIVLGAIWGLLTATRLLRGEEDAGRWELLLAGRTTRGGAAAQAGGRARRRVVALWVPTAVLAAGGGRDATVGIGVGASLFFATAVVAARGHVHGRRRRSPPSSPPTRQTPTCSAPPCSPSPT